MLRARKGSRDDVPLVLTADWTLDFNNHYSTAGQGRAGEGRAGVCVPPLHQFYQVAPAPAALLAAGPAS